MVKRNWKIDDLETWYTAYGRLWLYLGYTTDDPLFILAILQDQFRSLILNSCMAKRQKSLKGSRGAYRIVICPLSVFVGVPCYNTSALVDVVAHGHLIYCYFSEKIGFDISHEPAPLFWAK